MFFMIDLAWGVRAELGPRYRSAVRPAAVRNACVTYQDYEPARQVTRKDALLRNEFSSALVIQGTDWLSFWIACDSLFVQPTAVHAMTMNPSAPVLDAAISRYYAAFDEETRLQSGAFLLEALRTRELLDRHLPLPPATVLDVGGGAGAYSLWLTEKGYEAHLLDPVAKHIEKARRLNEPDSRKLASAVVGDARALPFGDGSADAVLMLGPLYHLCEEADRMRALAEANRVLRPGRVLCASAISRLASTLDGLTYDLFGDPAFVHMAEEDLRSGQHRNQTDRIEYFTTAYFHDPVTLAGEIAAAGFEAAEVFGIEGPAGILPDIGDRLADPQRRANVLRVARMLEREPAILGVSSHLLAVARKQR